MSKIKIESKLIGDETSFFSGYGILRKNEILFNENEIKTKIKIFEDKIFIERNNQYLLKIEFIRGKKTKATYNMYGNNYYFDILTKKLNIKDNNIYIEYDLIISDNQKMNFSYNIDYSIDS